MADFIKREDVLAFMEAQREQIKKQMDEALAYEHFHTRSDLKCALSQLEDDIFLLESMSAADVRPVVRGRWELYSPFTDTFACDQCGYQVIDETFRTNFCPNCGADMREVDDG